MASEAKVESPAKRMKMTKPKLGYWNIRGLARGIRLLLAHSKVDFEDVRYNEGKGHDFSRAEWTTVKDTLGLPFPNLPYFIDESVKLTQSNAILIYIANKHGLHKDFTAQEIGCTSMLLEQIMDLRNSAVRIFYKTYDGPQGQNVLQHRASAEKSFKAFAEFLGEKQWLLGDKLCAADFHLAEMLDQHIMLFPDLCKGDLDPLQKYRDRFFALPEIAKWIRRAGPVDCNNLHAKWRGKSVQVGKRRRGNHNFNSYNQYGMNPNYTNPNGYMGHPSAYAMQPHPMQAYNNRFPNHFH